MTELIRTAPPRRTAALLVVVLVGSLLALLPDLAQAHLDGYHPKGEQGEYITLDKDGYDNSGDDFTFTPTPVQVRGGALGLTPASTPGPPK